MVILQKLRECSTPLDGLNSRQKIGAEKSRCIVFKSQ